MKSIKFETDKCVTIHYERIKPFVNICKVTGVAELCNITIDYVPNSFVLDIVDYRKYFEQVFNDLIENIGTKVYDEIVNSIHPKKLTVTIYCEGNEHLTDWCCIIK